MYKTTQIKHTEIAITNKAKVEIRVSRRARTTLEKRHHEVHEQHERIFSKSIETST